MRQPLEGLRARLEEIAPHIVSHALWLPSPPSPEAALLLGALLDWLERPAEREEAEEALCALWRAALSLKGGRAPLSPEEAARLMCQLDMHAMVLMGDEGGGALMEWRRRWSGRLERLMRFAREEEEWLLGARARGEMNDAARLLEGARHIPSPAAGAHARALLEHAARSAGAAVSFSRLYHISGALDALTPLAALLRRGRLAALTVDAAAGELSDLLWATLEGARAEEARAAREAWGAHLSAESARWWGERLLLHALSDHAAEGRLALCVLNAQELTASGARLCERLLAPPPAEPISLVGLPARALEAPALLLALHTPPGVALPAPLAERDDLSPLSAAAAPLKERLEELLARAASLAEREGAAGEPCASALSATRDNEPRGELSDDDLWRSLMCLAEAGQLRWEGGWGLAALSPPSTPLLAAGARLSARRWALEGPLELGALAEEPPAPPPPPPSSTPRDLLSEEPLTRLAGSSRAEVSWAAARAGLMALCWRAGDLDLAAQLAEEAREGGADLFSPAALTALLGASARLAFARGKDLEGAQALSAAWGLAEVTGDLAGQARALALAGRLSAREGRPARAVTLLGRAARRWRLVDEAGEEARCALERAQLLRQLGVVREARAAAEDLRGRAPEALVGEAGLCRGQAGGVLGALTLSDQELHEEAISALTSLEAPLSRALEGPADHLSSSLALDALVAHALSLARLAAARAADSRARGEDHGGALTSLMAAARERARRARLHPRAAPHQTLGARLVETLLALLTPLAGEREERLALTGALSDLERAWGARAARGELDLSSTLRYALCHAEVAAARGDGFGVEEALSLARPSVEALARLLAGGPWEQVSSAPPEWGRLLELARGLGGAAAAAEK